MADARPTLRARLARAGRIASDICHVGLSVSLWLAGTLLEALGMVLAFLIVAADGRPLRFFAHVQNLSTHYLFADPLARAHFDRQVLALILGLVGLLVIARLPSFVGKLRRDMARGGRNG